MTCVLSQTSDGVALAADSAVTVGSAAQKIYTSVDKLFQLDENAPVGIMIYGNAMLDDLPWETIIKAYRSRPHARTLPRLTDYTTDFIRFLRTQKKMFSSAAQGAFVRMMAANFFAYLRADLERLPCPNAFYAVDDIDGVDP